MLNWLRRKPEYGVVEKLEHLLLSQCWDSDKIRSYQWGRLRDILSHAYSRVPYYRKKFDDINMAPEDIKTPEDYSRLPLLTKRDMQVHLEEMVAEGVDRKLLQLNSTGGSTGMPLNFYQNDNYIQWADAARLRAWRYMAGVDENALEGVFWGAIRDVGQGMSLKRVLYSILREGILPLNTFDLDEPDLRKYLTYYNLLKPPIVRGYASSLYYVASYVERTGVQFHQPKSVVSSTEVLHARMRETIERVFGCKVFDSYGCREVSQIATECDAHNGLHIVFENQYVELDGQDIVVTNLNNYAMPFIRYKVGDLASTIDYSTCSCGRSSPRIMNLIGRDNDNVELPNGKVINGEFFEFLFFGMSSVVQYQVIYHRADDYLLVKLQVGDDSKAAEEVIRKTMREKFNYSNVKIEYTDVFDKTPTGKLRFVYSVD